LQGSLGLPQVGRPVQQIVEDGGKIFASSMDEAKQLLVDLSISLYDSLALKLLNFLGEDNWEYDKFVGHTGTTFEFSRKFA
jgi:hypothetical protein